MNFSNQNTSKVNLVFTWVIFGLLMLYLLLRAYYLEAIHDEIATFFFYIESGVFWGPDVMFDANNHLLNSILSHWLYLIFGDQLFFIRLPNVIAFAFYFWGIYRLLKPIKSDLYKTFILLGTTCVPFVLEYFAYTRGYGISMGLFIFSLSYIRDFVVNQNVKSAYWSSLFLSLAVYANLTLILSLILMVLLFLLIQLLHKNELSRSQHKYLFLVYALIAVAMLPNFYYAKLLKESNALYYGGLDGFWEVTGKTLARYVIFHDLNWLKYASLGLVFLLVLYFIRRWVKLGYLSFFKRSSTILAWFLFGNCVAIVLMAKAMGVNYPEDRVGMHLVILFLLMFGFVLSEIKSMSWLLVGMLFFPITMIPRISLTTSVFSSDDRVSKPFFNEVVKKLDSYTTLSIYPIQQLTWAYLSREVDSNNFIISQRDFNRTSDIVFTKTTLYKDQGFLKDYNVIAHNPESTHIAYERKSPYHKKLIYNLPLNIVDSDDEFVSIFSTEIPDSLRNRKLQFHAHGDIEAENKFFEFAIITYSTFDKDMNSIDHKYMNKRWSNGKEKKFPLNFNYAVEELDSNENEIRIYIWNRKKEKISVTNGAFQILELTDRIQQ